MPALPRLATHPARLAAALPVTLALALATACRAAPPEAPASSEWEAQRERMVREQIEARGVRDPRVLAAMRAVPRHRFVPAEHREDAYADRPLPIGHGQTISQPYVVAAMTEAARPRPGDRFLEVGTGSGYQAAVLARLVGELYSVELLPALADTARERLRSLGYEDVTVVAGDGYAGLPEHAPFDGIVVTAAPPEVPPALLEQLAEGGRMVIPVGESFQQLRVIERTPEGIATRTLFPVRFVPMVPGGPGEP